MALGAIWVSGMLAIGCVQSASVSRGLQLYKANGCAGCHGPQGHGDGPLARNLPAAPIDFRDVSAFKHGTSEEAIAKTLAEGVALHQVSAAGDIHHQLVMPKFDHLTETERRSIALYLISLRADAQGRS